MNRQFKFNNGYTASVISFRGSYGYSQGLYEVGVIHNDQLCYNTILTDNVIGFLDDEEVQDVLEDIRALDRDDECMHR